MWRSFNWSSSCSHRSPLCCWSQVCIQKFAVKILINLINNPLPHSYTMFRLGFGSNNLSYPLVSMIANVSLRIIHPNYNSLTYANDLALLRLPLNITYNQPSISTIRLPQLAQGNFTFVNSTGSISGFGRTSDQSVVSERLRYTRVRVIEPSTCAAIFGNAVINANVTCTLGQNFNAQGPCANDNGGPLYITEAGGNTLIGIQSFIASAGCNAGYPAGFVRLGAYITWISQQAGIPVRN